jgi:hypothetical protein
MVGNLGLWGHVAKIPMMLNHTVFSRQDKRGIGVMVWVVDDVHEWRADSRTAGKLPVTRGAIRVE